MLANEEVVDGKSERGSHPVVRMPLRQWMLRITAYAERLLDDLTLVDWSESIKEMQRNWIGRSEGAEVDFALSYQLRARSVSKDEPIRVFTTRPDTLFGATYMVLAPEHLLVDAIVTPDQRAAVEAYKAEATRKSDLERTELAKKKTGVFTGAYAINPVNQEKVPIWIADYVLISYGTGAIMAVPAHDERDFEFAKQFKLHIRTVVRPPDEWLKQTGSTLDNLTEAFIGDGVAVNSGQFDGLPTAEFKRKITTWLEERRPGDAQDQLQAPRLALQPATLLGRAVPDPARGRCIRQSDRRGRSIVSGRTASAPPGTGRLQAFRPTRTAARQSKRLALGDAQRQALQARNQHHAPVGRLVLVLSALSRSDE